MKSQTNLFGLFPLIVVSIFPAMLYAQPAVEFLGLASSPITSLGTYEGIIAVGTYGESVFYQDTWDLPDSGWINAGLEEKNVSAVYPHKSGPLGWAIAAGVFPEGDDSIYVYCSFMGEEFVPNSAGISSQYNPGIYSLAGFPDPSICGEKYAATGAALYMQPWPDSVWTVIWSEPCIEGCTVFTVQTSEDMGAGGFVMAGGGSGMGGPLLIKSDDYGDTWEYVGGPISEVVALDFELNSSFTSIEKVFVSERGRIRRSLDGGSTWELVFEDEWNWFSEVEYDPFSATVFIAGGDGLDSSSAVLFFSKDLGQTWSQLPLPMAGPVVGMDMASDGYFYFATQYSGVYRINSSELYADRETISIPVDFLLHQPYPNPFNPTTTIEFSIPIDGDVTLTIFDILGREVDTILNKHMQAGHHKVQWNASDVSSGIYLIKMQSGDFTQVRKVMVLR